MSLLNDVLNEDRGLERDRELIEDLRDMRTEELISCIDEMVPYVQFLTEQGRENDAIVNEVCDIYSNIYQGSESNEEVDDKIEYLCHFARINGVCPSELEENREIFENTEKHEYKIAEFYDEKYGETGLSSVLKDTNEYERFANTTQGLLDVLEERGIHDPTLSFAIKHLNDDMKISEEISAEDRLLEPCINGFVRSLTDSEKESFLSLPIDEDRRTELSIDEAFAKTLIEHPPVHEIHRDRDAEVLSDKFEVIAEARGMEDDRYFREALADMREDEERGESSLFKVRELNDYMINFMDSLTTEERMYLIPKDAIESDKLYEQYSMDFCRTINGYANLNNEMLDRMATIIDDKRCLEVMAGTGLLSAALQERGIDILATDKSSPEHNDYHTLRGTPSLTEMEIMDARDAIREYGTDIDLLVMSWPPYDNPIAADCVKLLHEINPNAEILYIGEAMWGCTADDRFFETTEVVDRCDEVNDVKGNGSFSMPIHDKVEIRKPLF